MTTIISVNGLDGEVLARTSGTRRVEETAALVPIAEVSTDGKPGQDAPEAIRGSPAGLLVVELTESTTLFGGINVNVAEFQSREEPPSTVEVPIRKNILLTAIGGRGENGHRGGDGQEGKDGVDGVAATVVADAMPGSDAGDGGDAGRGSDGANGGNGGTIRIVLHENNTHLLLATSCEVRGGKGGIPGQHGKAGQGGKGGKGGEEHTWRELVGYKYTCTSNCEGTTVASSSNALVRAGSVMNTGTMSLVSGISSQVVQGGNLQAVIMEVARRYGASQHRAFDPGACKCHGGQGNCIGCDAKEIFKDFKRLRAKDGQDGRPGIEATETLAAGVDGNEGSATIIVQNVDGSRNEYTSRYELELVDFDIEDENGDGIFEPGEHIFIRRIRVRNTGGMPSPTRRAQITVKPTDWLKPVDGTDGETFVTASIAPGTSATLSGSIKLHISPNTKHVQLGGDLFERRETISLKAVMPWIDLELENFHIEKEVKLEYPCRLGKLESLSTMARGSRNRFTVEVKNTSNCALGSNKKAPRKVEVEMSFPKIHGALSLPSGEWKETVVQDIENVPAIGSTSVSQLMRISRNAEEYKSVSVQVDLHISSPGQNTSVEVAGDVYDEMVLVQSQEFQVQISSLYTRNPNSSILLVTNSRTERYRTESIQKFINDELKMEMDTWNLQLYGGLYEPLKEGDRSPRSLLASYHGKTIILLGNKFDFLESKSRDVAQLCESHLLAQALSRQSTVLLLETETNSTVNKLAKQSFLYPSKKIQETFLAIPTSNQYENITNLIETLTQERRFRTLDLQNYSIPMHHKWYKLGKNVLASEASRVAQCLQKHLPQERFLVSWYTTKGFSEKSEEIETESDLGSNSNSSFIIIYTGVGHRAMLKGVESITKLPVDGLSDEEMAQESLELYERYMIVASLPLAHRVQIVWESETRPSHTTCSDFALKAVELSIIVEIQNDIKRLLDKSFGVDKLIPNASKSESQSRADFIIVHLQALNTLIHGSGKSKTVPDSVLEILRWTLASVRPQRKRHIMQATIFPLFERRRRLYGLLIEVIGELLRGNGYPKEGVEDFWETAKEIHSTYDSTKRDTENLVVRKISDLAKRSENLVRHGRTEMNAVPLTEWCTPEEWDSRVHEMEQSSRTILEESEKARDVLYVMSSME